MARFAQLHRSAERRFVVSLIRNFRPSVFERAGENPEQEWVIPDEADQSGNFMPPRIGDVESPRGLFDRGPKGLP
jgi:hypothetical protein